MNFLKKIFGTKALNPIHIPDHGFNNYVYDTGAALSEDDEKDYLLHYAHIVLNKWNNKMIEMFHEGHTDPKMGYSDEATILKNYKLYISANESGISLGFMDNRLNPILRLGVSYMIVNENSGLNESSIVSNRYELKTDYIEYDNRVLKLVHQFQAHEVHIPRKMRASKVDRQHHSGAFYGNGVYGPSYTTETVKEWTEVPAHNETQYSNYLSERGIEDDIDIFLRNILGRVTKNNIFINSHKDRDISNFQENKR